MPALRRWVLARPRVLLVEAPGSRDLRWATEADLERRRWPAATSPADTDLLVILGRPGPALSAAIDVLWTVSSPELYELLVLHRGWTPAQFATFVADTMSAALLPSRA